MRPHQSPSYDHLEAVALLTAMRDSQALNAALVKIVGGLAPGARVDLFDLCNLHNDREFHSGNTADAVVRSVANPLAPEQALADCSDFSQCVAQQAVVTNTSDTGTRTVFPIAGVRYLTSLLAVEGAPLAAQTEADINYLLRIYGNQRFLMNKGEFDALTGLLNRQAFDERMKQLMSARARLPGSDASGISFAILDIDYFKKVNDQYGHLYGDEVLLLFAQLMSRSFRQCDLLFRYGGEEFALIMTHKLPLALAVLERFRLAVEGYRFPQIGQKTVSIGVVEIDSHDILSGVIDKADKALYHAKNGGRNRVCAYETLHTEGVIEAPKHGGDVELF